MESRIIFEKNYYTEGNVRSDPVKTENFLLYQVGDAYYYNGLQICGHEQYFDVELSIAAYNAATFFTDGEGTEAKKNDVYVSLKGETHAISAKNTFRYRYFAFDVRENSKFRAYLPEINARYAHEKILQSRTVTALAGRIISEFMRGEVCADLLDCLLGEIVVELRRGGAEEKSLEINDGKQAALEARNYIDGHYLELNSLAELSARCGYSYPYLSKIFSASAGMSLRRYFAEKRMEHAKEMLQEGKSVTEAAEALSYNSICNFSRAFKRYFGRSPEAFKPPRG